MQGGEAAIQPGDRPPGGGGKPSRLCSSRGAIGAAAVESPRLRRFVAVAIRLDWPPARGRPSRARARERGRGPAILAAQPSAGHGDSRLAGLAHCRHVFGSRPMEALIEGVLSSATASGSGLRPRAQNRDRPGLSGLVSCPYFQGRREQRKAAAGDARRRRGVQAGASMLRRRLVASTGAARNRHTPLGGALVPFGSGRSRRWRKNRRFGPPPWQAGFFFGVSPPTPPKKRGRWPGIGGQNQRPPSQARVPCLPVQSTRWVFGARRLRCGLPAGRASSLSPQRFRLPLSPAVQARGPRLDRQNRPPRAKRLRRGEVHLQPGRPSPPVPPNAAELESWASHQPRKGSNGLMAMSRPQPSPLPSLRKARRGQGALNSPDIQGLSRSQRKGGASASCSSCLVRSRAGISAQTKLTPALCGKPRKDQCCSLPGIEPGDFRPGTSRCRRGAACLRLHQGDQAVAGGPLLLLSPGSGHGPRCATTRAWL